MKLSIKPNEDPRNIRGKYQIKTAERGHLEYSKFDFEKQLLSNNKTIEEFRTRNIKIQDISKILIEILNLCVFMARNTRDSA